VFCVIPTIGRRHPTIRRLRALRRDAALRRQQSVFLAEGVHLALEALRSDADVELVVCSGRLSSNEEGRDLLRAIERRALQAVETADAVLDSLQDARSPQPVLTLVRRRSWPPQAGLEDPGLVPLVAAACGVQDPGNLGGLLRTADAAGATAFFVSQGSVDPFHPRAVRATMGSIFRVPVHVEPEDTLLLRLRDHGLRLVATDPAGGLDYDRCDLRGPVALLFGGEGPGLSAALRGRADESLRVPMRREMNSLSVGAAAAVVLFEAARQRRAG
jgi:TrmH family RNA methyltransferase